MLMTEVRELCGDGGGYRRRVRGSTPRRQYAGKKRGPPPKEDVGSTRVRRCTAKKLTWTTVGREEYARVTGDYSSGGYRQRFERGQGGGVT